MLLDMTIKECCMNVQWLCVACHMFKEHSCEVEYKDLIKVENLSTFLHNTILKIMEHPFPNNINIMVDFANTETNNHES